MKVKLLFIYLLFYFFATAQQQKMDSLKNELSKKSSDTARVKNLNNLAFYIYKTDSANAFNFTTEAYKLSEKNNYVNGKIEALLVKSGFFIFKSKGTNAIPLLNEANDLAKKLSNKNQQARVLRELGQAKYTVSKFQDAIKDLELAESIYISLNNPRELDKVYESIAINYAELGNYDLSVSYLIKSLSLKEKFNQTDGLGSVYNNLGRQLYNLKNFVEAIKYYEKSSELSKQKGDYRTYGVTQVNIANIFITQQNYKEGEKRLLMAIESFEKIGFKRGIQTCYNNLGAINLRTSDFQNGINYLQKALSIANANQNKQGVPLIQNNIGYAYRELNNYNESLKWHIEAENTAEQFTADVYTFTEIYKFRALLDSAMGNFKSAYSYKTKYQNLYEKSLNDKNIATVNELQTKYETQQKENKILTLSQADSIKSLQILSQQAAINKNLLNLSQQQLLLAEDSILLFSQSQALLQNKLEASLKEEKISNLSKEALQKQLIFEQQEAVSKRKKQVLTSLLIGTILMAGLLLLVLHQRNKKKQALAKADAQKALVNSILETEEKERTRIAKDLHDGIVQDLTAIKLQLNTINETATTDVKNKLLGVLQHVETTSKEVREISYQMMPLTLRELGLEKALNELLNRSLSNKNISFEFDAIGIETRLSEKIETTVYRICQELLNNTIKHSKATAISLLLQLRNNNLQITYEDNGIGFDNNKVKKGIGLNSLNSRVEMVNGKLEFDDTIQTGTAAYIKIPLG